MYKINSIKGIAVCVLILITLGASDGEDWCPTPYDSDSPYTYVHIGKAVLDAAAGDPVGLCLIGAEYLVRYVEEKEPGWTFLKSVQTALECVDTANQILSPFNKLFRGKRVAKMPAMHDGKYNITAVTGEYVLQKLQFPDNVRHKSRQRFSFLLADPHHLPCDFNYYDRDGNDVITKEEFHEVTEEAGFWREDRLYQFLQKGGRKEIDRDTFKRNAPLVHNFMKFSECSKTE